MTLILSQWNFLFCCKTFSFAVRHFLLLCHFFFHHENLSSENSSTQSEYFWLSIQEQFDRLCSLCLVLWGRPFYGLGKFREPAGSDRLCSLWLVLSARLFYSPEYKYNLDKGKVYRGKLCHVSETLSVH